MVTCSSIRTNFLLLNRSSHRRASLIFSRRCPNEEYKFRGATQLLISCVSTHKYIPPIPPARNFLFQSSASIRSTHCVECPLGWPPTPFQSLSFTTHTSAHENDSEYIYAFIDGYDDTWILIGREIQSRDKKYFCCFPYVSLCEPQ